MTEISKDRALETVEKLARKHISLKEASIESAERGSSNHTFFVNQKFVVKIEKRDDWKENMQREPAILKAVEDAAIKTPKVIDSGVIENLHYRITELLKGNTIDQYSSGKNFYQQDLEEKKKLAKRIGKTLAKIHEAKSFRRFGTITAGQKGTKQVSAENWSKGVIDLQRWWLEKLRQEDFKETAYKAEKILEEHSDQLDKATESRLLHMEFDLRNLLFQKEDIAVVDWEMAAAGDPLLDLVITEKRLVWRQNQSQEIKQSLRKGYKTVREIEDSPELERLYEIFQMTRLLLIHQEDKEMVKKIKKSSRELFI
jgi:aminoglycoside phosphotransferase (APT) family kinase protein